MNPKYRKKEKAYLQLKSDIISRRLDAGQTITEDEIVKKFSISRTPVREIFRKLENDGLVMNIPYKGTFVSNLTKTDIEEIMDLRYVIEGFAAYTAADRIKYDEIKILKKIEEQLRQAQKNKNSMIALRAGINLHEFIYLNAGNQKLQSIISKLLGQIHRLKFSSASMEVFSDIITKEHLEIIAAVKAKSPALSEEKMKNHIQNTKSRLLQCLIKEEQFNSVYESLAI